MTGLAWRVLAPSLLALALLHPAPAAEDPWVALTVACDKPPVEAETALEELLRRDPGFLAARFNLGTLLITKDPARAAEQLSLATSDPNPALAADAWHNLALARWHQGRLDDALQAADSAAKLNPLYVPLRDELRRAAIARADQARRTAEEEAKRLAVDTLTLPEARVGEAYRATLPVHGGTPPYRTALAPAPTPASPPGTTVTLDAAGAPTSTPAPAVAPPSPVPPGLSLNADGTITGTPSASGTFRVPVLATDAAKTEANATGTVTVVVLPQPAITTTTLPEAIIGQPYTAHLAAEGLRSPRWSASGLPAGLICDPSGLLRGTPTALDTATVTLSAEDPVVPPARLRRAERPLPLAVTDAFAPDAPPAPATAGAAYEHRVGVRGPAQAYTWSASDGPLTVEPDGRLHGTPAAEGTITRPATIHAADGRSREVLLSVPVNPRPLITAAEPIRLRAGQPADVEIPHSGGTAPFAWKVGDGALPPGLRLDPDGHLRGVAKDPGSYTVTVQLEDHWKARTQASVAVTVEPSPDGKGGKDDKPNDKPDDKPGDKQDQAGEKPQKNGEKAGDQHKPEQQPGGDEKEPGKDPANKDQANKDQSGKDPAQQDQAKDPDKDKDKKDGTAAQAAKGPDQAAQLNQLAADRWLDQLPAEDRSVLRYQLLDGGERKPAKADKQGNSW